MAAVAKTDAIFRSLRVGTKFDKNRLPELAIFQNQNQKSVPAPLTSSKKRITDVGDSSEESDHATADSGKSRKRSVGQEKDTKLEKKSKIEAEFQEKDDSDQGSEEVAEPIDETESTEFTPKAIRKHNKIRVTGSKPAAPITSWDSLTECFSSPQYLLENIQSLGFVHPTPIQMQAIPSALEGSDILACAPTGSGKTLAYMLPLLDSLQEPAAEGFRAVIVAPTRELTAQIHRELTRLATMTSSAKPHKDSSAAAPKWHIHLLSPANANANSFGEGSSQRFDILVATPDLLSKAIKDNAVVLKNVRHLILDEADKLFELGYIEHIDEIIHACQEAEKEHAIKQEKKAGKSTKKDKSSKKSKKEEKSQAMTNDDVAQTQFRQQRSLFSATMPPKVEELTRTFLRNPTRILVGARNAAAELISQRLVFCGKEEGKLMALRDMFRQGMKPPVLIFVQSKERAEELYRELMFENWRVEMMSPFRTTAERDEIVRRFRCGDIWVLISTDLLARGMDFKGVKCVVNYDFPISIAQYIHRIGRTGRAGRSGEAVTFYTEADLPMLRTIANVMKNSGMNVDSWMLSAPKLTPKLRRQFKKNQPPSRKAISSAPVEERRAEQRKRKRVLLKKIHKKIKNTSASQE